MSLITQERFRAEFEKVDADGDNTINRTQFDSLCRALGITVTPAEKNILFARNQKTFEEITKYLEDGNFIQSAVVLPPPTQTKGGKEQSSKKEEDKFSDTVAAYKPVRAGVYQDMGSPLSHYFAFSCHPQLSNTTGVTPINEALLTGCRSIVLDVWDGKTEPLVSPVFPKKEKLAVSFGECMKAIKANAFTKSAFPLLVTINDHCENPNKAQMAKSIEEEIGSLIHTDSQAKQLKLLLSPKALKNKIILHLVEHPSKKKKKPQFDVDTSETGYEKFVLLRTAEREAASESDTVVCSCLTYEQIDITQMARNLQHTQRHFLLSQPTKKVTDPSIAWNCGSQIVPISWDSESLYHAINLAFFQDNGNCGYIIKPPWMTGKVAAKFDESSPTSRVTVSVLAARELGHKSAKKHFVEVEMFGLTHDRAKFGTKMVKAKNCCVWEEEFNFDLKSPETAVLVLTLKTKGFRSLKVIGRVAFCVSNMNKGKYAVPLNQFSSLNSSATGSDQLLDTASKCLVINLQKQAMNGNNSNSNNSTGNKAEVRTSVDSDTSQQNTAVITPKGGSGKVAKIEQTKIVKPEPTKLAKQESGGKGPKQDTKQQQQSPPQQPLQQPATLVKEESGLKSDGTKQPAKGRK